MQKKILHLVTDEKFTDYAIKQFSAPEMCSEFVLIPSNYLPGESEVKSIDKVNVIKQGSKEFEQLIQHLNQYCAIIFHGMFWPQWQVPVLNSIPDGVKVAWVFWGGEIYGQPDIANSFLAPPDKFLNMVHSIRRHLLGKDNTITASLPKEYYDRIDYCLTAIQPEFEFVRRYLGKPKMRHLWYNYYSIEETLGAAFNKQCSGVNIWVGNSATISCNFFDLLLRLREVNIGKRDVVVPLSYGAPWLKKKVSQAYSLVFGNHFKPIKCFLPREEYNERMLSCSVMIQPHYLSQGIGNILTGLWLGMRVYLSEHCITFGYLKQIGITFYSIERDLKKDNPYLFEPLSQDIINHNRKMLIKETGLQRSIDANNYIVKVFTSDQ